MGMRDTAFGPPGGSGAHAPAARPRIAIAHDYLTQRGGAEKVVLAMARAFPDAPIYTMLYHPERTYPEFAGLDVRVSRLNSFQPLRRHHRAAFPLLPSAASSIEIDADVVLASSSGWAHGFRTSGRKLVYCHSPARWIYDAEEYLGRHAGMAKRGVLAALSGRMRAWDQRAAASAHTYLTNSHVVRARVESTYGITAEVLPAPVTCHLVAPQPVPEAEAFLGGRPYYLCVSRLLPYKRVEQVVAAFAGTDRRLVVVGDGPGTARLREQLPANVLLLQHLTDGQVCALHDGATAVVSASREDFGLTPIEAGFHGTPSVVLRGGGFLDTVLDGETGVFFDRPEPADIRAALDRLEGRRWSPERIREHVAQFSEERFAAALRGAVDDVVASRPAAPTTGSSRKQRTS